MRGKEVQEAFLCVSYNVHWSIKTRNPFYLLLALNLFLGHNNVLRLSYTGLQVNLSHRENVHLHVQSILHIFFETHSRWLAEHLQGLEVCFTHHDEYLTWSRRSGKT